MSNFMFGVIALTMVELAIIGIKHTYEKFHGNIRKTIVECIADACFMGLLIGFAMLDKSMIVGVSIVVVCTAYLLVYGYANGFFVENHIEEYED